MAQQLAGKLLHCALATILMLLYPFIAPAQKTEAGNIIYFDLNVPTLNSAARHTVDVLLTANKIKKNQKLLLYGYADYLGTRAHNDSLSTERAMNVRAYLLGKGIPEDNITICVGKGQIARQPRTDHKGYAQDRKVEIITDAGKMKTLTCKALAKCEPLQWSKNISNLNVHGSPYNGSQELTDKTVSVRLPNGDKYIGEISKDGTKVSGGIYIWASGDKYKGGYKNDKKDGQGAYTWANGDMLDGVWQGDEIISGTLTIPYNGVLYHSDAAHSHSDAVYQGSLQYTGAFANHMFNGHGVAVWPNNDRYEGDWLNDKMSGHGVYKWAGGGRYEGLWLENKMNGYGIMMDANGNMTQEGNWENDTYKGK